jgi:hypothetical protein
MMFVKDIAAERMSLNRILLMNIYIMNCVLLLTEGLLNFYNCYVRVTTFKENI